MSAASWDDEFQNAISHPVRRKIIELLQHENLSFMTLLKVVDGKNHGTLGYHLRALKEFIEIESSTNKYYLTEKGRSLAAYIQDLDYTLLASQKISRYIQSLAVKEHAVAFYETDDFKHQILTPFFKTGLQRGEAVVYLLPEAKLTSETREVQRFGIDFDLMPMEAFTVMSADDWYLKKGKADSKVIKDNWMDLVKKRKKVGFKGLRVAGDVEPFYDSAKNKELLEYEESLGRRFTFDICAVCLYNWNKFDKKQFRQIYRCHGHIISKSVFGSTKRFIFDKERPR